MLVSLRYLSCKMCLAQTPYKSLVHMRRKENPQKLTQLSSRSHLSHLVGKRTAQKDTIIDITSDSQVNSNFPYRWSLASCINVVLNKYLSWKHLRDKNFSNIAFITIKGKKVQVSNSLIAVGAEGVRVPLHLGHI